MKTRGPDPLQDALELEAQIKTLKTLLELQRRQFEIINDRLYAAGTGNVAARRLMGLKQAEARSAAPRKRRV